MYNRFQREREGGKREKRKGEEGTGGEERRNCRCKWKSQGNKAL
jgi:hypothetical protein